VAPGLRAIPESIAIIRVNELLRVHGQQLFTRVAGDAHNALVEVNDASVLKDPDGAGGQVCNGAKLCFAFTERTFHLQAVGNVLAGSESARFAADLNHLNRIEGGDEAARLGAKANFPANDLLSS